jgi:hypothetical protein
MQKESKTSFYYMREKMNKRHIAVTVLLLLVSVAFMNGYANDDLFHVEGNILHMNGDINSDTPDLLIEALESNPHVQEIIMHEVPGSLDDDSNLAAARVVREQGLRTRVLPDSMIASGGVDFFLAGTKRYVAKGAMIGVHSWGDGATMEGRNYLEHISITNYILSIIGQCRYLKPFTGSRLKPLPQIIFIL